MKNLRRKLLFCLSILAALIAVPLIVVWRTPTTPGSVSQFVWSQPEKAELVFGPPAFQIGAYRYWLFEDGIGGVLFGSEDNGLMRVNADRSTALWWILRRRLGI